MRESEAGGEGGIVLCYQLKYCMCICVLGYSAGYKTIDEPLEMIPLHAIVRRSYYSRVILSQL